MNVQMQFYFNIGKKNLDVRTNVKLQHFITIFSFQFQSFKSQLSMEDFTVYANLKMLFTVI